ncbi:MAG: iron ABC transporter permease, partial [Mesorhizobium sp.]
MASAIHLTPSALPAAGMKKRRAMSWITLAAALISLIALLPLAFIVWIAIQTGWDTVVALIFRPRVGELLINTVLLVIVTVPIAIALSVALAWLTERSDLPGNRLWSWLSVAPLAIPAFVHSYAWISFVPGLHGLWAGVLVSVIAYVPFLYLPISAALR